MLYCIVLCHAVVQVDLVAVDSVAALLPRSELEGVIGDQQVSSIVVAATGSAWCGSSQRLQSYAATCWHVCCQGAQGTRCSF